MSTSRYAQPPTQLTAVGTVVTVVGVVAHASLVESHYSTLKGTFLSFLIFIHFRAEQMSAGVWSVGNIQPHCSYVEGTHELLITPQKHLEGPSRDPPVDCT